MATQDSDTYSPKTSRDWFLHDLFNDPEFVRIRKDFKHELGKFDPGISQLLELPVDARTEELLGVYSKRAQALFGISEQTARKGLFHNKHLNTWSRDRGASAHIDGHYVTISIGSETRIEDVKNIWTSKIAPLQDELSSRRAKRLVAAKSPSLAYAIHKQLLMGKTMAEVHDDYLHLNLGDYDGPYGNEEYSEFARSYKSATSGI